MISQRMYELGSKKSTIREIFEYAKQRAAIVGSENIFDFSIGNPSVPPPDCVNDSIREILATEDSTQTHGYTTAHGDPIARAAVAQFVNQKFGTDYTADHFYITVGAAASIRICLAALTNPGDEYIIFAPFFPEYAVWVEDAGAKLNVVPADTDSFQIDFAALKQQINAHTKGIIVNSPNNPSGAVYSLDTIKQLAQILKEASQEYGHPIFLIADEPYREIVYDGIQVPHLPLYYPNTLICYSYSKALSLPGERIGYILVPPSVLRFADVYAAICGGGRVLGYVNAPSLFQKVIARCGDQTSDISVYKKNRDLLYDGLTKMGYTCVKPGGTFYLFPRCLEADAVYFCKKAQQYDLLLVPGDDFACPGHFRIAYCVPTERIERALPVFARLAKDYGL